VTGEPSAAFATLQERMTGPADAARRPLVPVELVESATT
jgi:hypothetical protein